jgi:hypothetical protein
VTTTPIDPVDQSPDAVEPPGEPSGEPTAEPEAGAAPRPAALPPNPEAYDSPRNELARRRGLPQPYIMGGDDPNLAETLRRERRYVRLLVAMVVVIVAMGFVLGIAAALVTAPR